MLSLPYLHPLFTQFTLLSPLHLSASLLKFALSPALHSFYLPLAAPLSSLSPSLRIPRSNNWSPNFMLRLSLGQILVVNSSVPCLFRGDNSSIVKFMPSLHSISPFEQLTLCSCHFILVELLKNNPQIISSTFILLQMKLKLDLCANYYFICFCCCLIYFWKNNRCLTDLKRILY